RLERAKTAPPLATTSFVARPCVWQAALMADTSNPANTTPSKAPEDVKYAKGSGNDLSNGPAGNRGCTDCWCLFVLFAAWGAYVAVTIAGFADGNPAKLYLPRDYSGSYCDAEKNWNDGPNLKGFTKLAFTMNATSTTDMIVKQLVCSSYAKDVLTTNKYGGALLTSRAEQQDYLCDCCITPCAKCSASLQVGGDLTSANLQGTISGKMGDLTGANNPANLFSPSGANGDVFTNMWAEATKYFNQVCLPDCNTNFQTLNGSSSNRPDNPLSSAWSSVKAFTSSSTETFGTWVGDFQKSVDSFIVVAVCCFVISFIFMVVLRLFIKVCVWFAVFMCLIILAGGGGLAMLRSNQCAGVGMMESGQQVAVATAVASTTA
ncbi:unnamed protein product, partial [Polarella glacialis]